MYDYERALIAVKTETGLVYDSNEEYVQSLWDIDAAADGAAESIGGVTYAIGSLSKANIAKQAIEALDDALRAGDIEQEDYNASLRLIGTSMLGLSDAEINTVIAMKDLTTQFASGDITLKQFTTTTQQLGRETETTNRLQEGLKRSMEEYNVVMHEAPALQYEAAQGIERSRNMLKLQGETIAETIPQLTELQEELLYVGGTGDMTASSLGSVKNATDNLYSKHVIITAEFRAIGDTWIAPYTEGVTPGQPGFTFGSGAGTGWQYGTGASSKDQTPFRRAFGGGVSMGMPSIIGDAGVPEVFVPMSNGYIYPNKSNFEDSIASAVSGALMKIMGNLQQSANNYNLSVNSVQSMGSIIQDFDLMRLLA